MLTVSEENIERRKKRRKQTAEVFTPNKLVKNLLDKLPDEVWEEKEENTFLDPACGNGNFLVHALWRKISRGHDPTGALSTIYGLDIKRDNIKECRLRLLKIISLFENINEKHIRIIFRNIRFLNSVQCPNGFLDYDMSFKHNYNMKNVNEWLEGIQKGEFELFNLPVSDNDVAIVRSKNGKSLGVEDSKLTTFYGDLDRDQEEIKKEEKDKRE